MPVQWYHMVPDGNLVETAQTLSHILSKKGGNWGKYTCQVKLISLKLICEVGVLTRRRTIRIATKSTSAAFCFYGNRLKYTKLLYAGVYLVKSD